MEVIYTLTKEDVLGFQRFHLNRKGKRRWMLFSNLLCVIVWVFQLWLVIQYAVEWRRYASRLGPHAWEMFMETHQQILIILLIISLLLLYMFWGQKVLRRRQISPISVLSTPKRMRIGPDGVEVITERERLSRPWAEIKEIDSDMDRLYLYVTPTTALILPKRTFDSAGMAQAFEAQARAYRQNPYAPGSQINSPTDAAVWPPPPQIKAAENPTQAAEPDDMPGAYQLHYLTRKADLWRSQVSLISRRPSILLGLFIPYVLAVGLWVFTLGHTSFLMALLWTILGASVVTLLTLAWRIQKALKLSFTRFPDERPCRIILRPDMLCDVTPDDLSMYPWSEVLTVRRRFGDLYILTKGNRGVVIPRTAFSDQHILQELVETIERFRRESQAAAVQQTAVTSVN